MISKSLAYMSFCLKQSRPSLLYLNNKRYFTTDNNLDNQQKNTNENTKSNVDDNKASSSAKIDPNYYYPIKRISFLNQKEFPVFITDEKAGIHSSKQLYMSIWSCGFTLYFLNWMLFLDIKNYWHAVPLAYLLYKSIYHYFDELTVLHYNAKTIYFKEDGETLIITLPNGIPTQHLTQNVKSIPNYVGKENDIKLEVKISDIVEIDFLDGLIKKEEEIIKQKREYEMEPGLIKLAPKKKKDAKKEKMTEVNNGNVSEDNESNLIVLYIRNKSEPDPISITADLSKNKNSAYNDYLVALGKKKKIVWRKTKDEPSSQQ